jgi:peptidyl-dipeptidase Dcp
MNNPLFEPWTAPFGAPPLDRIRPEHFAPAYARALAEHEAEIAAIASDSAPPSFDNVIVALETSGRLLARVDSVFSNLAASRADAALQEIEREMAPLLSAHWSAILMNGALFARIDAVYRAQGSLDDEAARVLTRYRTDFLRAGAGLPEVARARLAAIGARLAVLGTLFSQNVLAEEDGFVLALDEARMKGVPETVRAAAAALAQEKGLDAPYAVSLSRSSIEPMLQYADDRALREQLFRAFVSRGGHGGPHDNSAIVAETLALRNERARLLGHADFAAYKLADSMAGTPAEARALMEAVWAPARACALAERDALQGLIAREGGNFRLAPWDWRYYAEKLRRERYAFNEAELTPYLELGNMIAAGFHTAERLFGLTFAPRDDIPVYHPDVRVWEVRRDGAVIGIFYGDYFARPGKQGGAWMSSLRDQDRLNGAAPGDNVLPLVVNNCNFSKAEPCLLSFDDAVTLFHEFGHALHGLLSQVRFPRLSGTNVARDFVELPSQLFEHWLEERSVLERFARHYRTGATIPPALLDRLLAARKAGQGFETVEFLASAIIDMDLHSGPQTDPLAAAADTLKRIAMPGEIVPRHGVTHFSHLFGGDGYAAGYYAYLWSEVLDADGFQAFREAGGPFDAATAQRLHDFIYSAGGSRDFADAYRAFRGGDPDVAALLEGRGLTSA